MSDAPIFLINGAPAAGKTTLSHALMARFPKSIHIPVDDLREWVVGGLSTPINWTEETERQFRIAEEAAADLAIRYQSEGFAVAIDHCRRTDRLDELCSDRFGGLPLYKVALYSTLELNLARNAARITKAFDYSALEPVIHDLNRFFGPEGPEKPGWILLENERKAVEEAVDRLLERIQIKI